MSVVFNPVGILVFILLIGCFFWGARISKTGALSLPSLFALTSIIYFFLMPLIFLGSGENSFFGLALVQMASVHLAVGLYALGAIVAFITFRRALQADPLLPLPSSRAINPVLLWGVFGLAIAGIMVKIALGRLSLGLEADAGDQAQNLNFLELSDSLLISFTLVFLVRDRFRPRSLAVLAFAFAVFLVDGFRFRLVILSSATIIAFMLTHRVRIRVPYVIGGGILAIAVLNAIGLSRRYGRGLDLTQLQGLGFRDLLLTIGAEVGPVFVLYHLTTRPPADFVFFEPWIVAISRLVPSFLWKDKPFPEYLLLVSNGFPDSHAAAAGVAETQQAEFFLQFGWIGLPILAFAFFSGVLWLLKRVQRLSPEARVAGTAIFPAFFGFYAQQRGYTFQLVCETLFTLVPLFAMHWGGRLIGPELCGPVKANRLA